MKRLFFLLAIIVLAVAAQAQTTFKKGIIVNGDTITNAELAKIPEISGKLDAANGDTINLKLYAKRLETVTNARIDHTGTTAETTLETITIPAGSIGPNGLIEFEIVANGPSSANNKITRLKDQSGNVLWSSGGLTTNPNIRVKIFVANRNSLTSQVSGNIVIFGSSQSTSNNVIATSHNSANGLTFTLTGQLGSASEHLYIEYKSVFTTHGGN